MSLFSPLPHSFPSSISTLDAASMVLRHGELHRDLQLYRRFPHSPLARWVLRAHETTCHLGADYVHILSSALHDLQTAVAAAESRHNEACAANIEFEYRAALARLVWPDAKLAGGTVEIPALPAETHGLQKQLNKEKERADMAMKKYKIRWKSAEEHCRQKENAVWCLMEQLRIWEAERWRVEIVGRLQEYVKWDVEAKTREEQRMEADKKAAEEKLKRWKIEQDRIAKEKEAKDVAKKKLEDARLEAERKAHEQMWSEHEVEKRRQNEEIRQRAQEDQEKLDRGDPAALQRQSMEKLAAQFKAATQEDFNVGEMRKCYENFQKEEEKAAELGPEQKALWVKIQKSMTDALKTGQETAMMRGELGLVRKLMRLKDLVAAVDKKYQQERKARWRRNLRGDTYDDSLPDETFRLAPRAEAIVKDGVVLPLLASQKDAIDGWLDSRTKAFRDRASLTAATFPEPPMAPCYRKECLTKAHERNLKACECTIRNLFRICFRDEKSIKKERLQWHPDRFSTCHNEEIDRKAQEIFTAATQVLDALVLQASLEERYGPIAEWRTTKEWASEAAWRERKLARRKERTARQAARHTEGAEAYLSDSGDEGSDQDKWIPKKTERQTRFREAAAKQRRENEGAASPPEAEADSSSGPVPMPESSVPQPKHNADTESQHRANPDTRSTSRPEPKPEPAPTETQPDTHSRAGRAPCSEQADPRNAHHSWALILWPGFHEHPAQGCKSSPSGATEDPGDRASSTGGETSDPAADDLYDAMDDGQDRNSEQQDHDTREQHSSGLGVVLVEEPDDGLDH